MNKRYKNSVRKLIEAEGVANLLATIEEVALEMESRMVYETVFATDESAVEWFLNICAEYGVTAERSMIEDRDGNLVPYGRYRVKELDNPTKPYFTLWIRDGHQNDDQIPHMECGDSYAKPLSFNNMMELEEVIDHVCRQHGYTKRKEAA